MRRMEDYRKNGNNRDDNYRCRPVGRAGWDVSDCCEGDEAVYEELIGKAHEYFLRGDIDLAQICYQYAGMAGPYLAMPHIGLGVIAMMRGLMEEAKVCFEMALWLEENCAQACCGMAVALQNLDEGAAAMELYTRCLSEEPGNFTAILGALYLAILRGEIEEVSEGLISEFTVAREDVEMAMSFLMPFSGRRAARRSDTGRAGRYDFDDDAEFMAELFVGSFCEERLAEKTFTVSFILN